MARTWLLNSKCCRFWSLSKPVPSSTSPWRSTRTSLSETIFCSRFRNRSSCVAMRVPSEVARRTLPRAVMSRVTWLISPSVASSCDDRAPFSSKKSTRTPRAVMRLREV